jgi:hypothetical protein
LLLNYGNGGKALINSDILQSDADNSNPPERSVFSNQNNIKPKPRKPANCRARRYSKALLDFIDSELEKLRDDKVP